MRNVADALQMLHAEPDVIRHSPFLLGIDAQKECSSLVRTRDDLRTHIGKIRVGPAALDPESVWRRFELAGGDLSKLNSLEVRTLCEAAEFAVRPKFVQALRSQPDRLEKSRCLYGMVNSYFSRWREMAEPEKLEDLLKAAIAHYPHLRRPIDRWRSTPSLFSPDAANRLAEFIVERQSSVETVLKLQYIGPATRLAVLAHATTARLATGKFRAQELISDEQGNLRYLDWLIRDLLTETLLNGALHEAVSSLILSRSAERSESFQQTLRSYVQSCPRLGDPRLRQSGPNWSDMEPEAKQRFLSWLAKESILFFFDTILPRNDHNRRRAEFWLKYHKQIKDFQVAISDQDYWKLQANKSKADLPLHSRVTQGQTSAFLMKFQGYGTEFIIVEFSETGNAAYIYERAAFESRDVTLRASSFQLNRDLKNGARRDRILHLHNWEGAARQTLAECGIWP